MTETNSPEQDRASGCKTNPELTGQSPKEREERVFRYYSAESADAIARKVVERWCWDCGGVVKLGFAQWELLQQRIREVLPPDLPQTVPSKSLSDYTDAEIANEHHARAMRVLGDQTVGVGVPTRTNLIGGTAFCGHGMMAVLCPTCAKAGATEP